jgi:hypothetical protein
MRIRSKRLHSRSLLGQTTIAILTWLMGTAAIAHAHGGMAGPDELGPPLFTSVALGFVCYWLVILWPSSKPKDNAPTVTGKRSRKDRRSRRGASGKPGDNPQHSSHLTKVASRERS